MILPDVNLLLYAYNPHVSQHDSAKNWWETCLNSDEGILLPYEILFGFIRIATHKRYGNASLEEAKQTVDTWFTAP